MSEFTWAVVVWEAADTYATIQGGRNSSRFCVTASAELFA